PHSDVFASGASDGIVRLWCVGKSSFSHIRSIRIPNGGYINAMEWNKKGNILFCGVGDEHRLGRWEHVLAARNGLCIIELPIGAEDGHNSISAEQCSIKFDDAVHWDRWSPLEKGYDQVNLKKMEEQLTKQKLQEQSQDKINDEWSNFFGKAFGTFE
ncbi:U3 small nucleolar interacting protein 2, partial [Reticulomyxa filosa]